MKSKITQIRFNKEDVEKLKKIAEKQNTTMSSIIRQRSLGNPIEKKLDKILMELKNAPNAS